ncbi:MAG TPA: hypothetical protein PKE55_09940 [Kiritimatiellia bacterium]|nr:hypothetical protein [Kiritimatiellia bacterium]
MEETTEREAKEPMGRESRRERAAADVLRTLIRDTYGQHFGALLPKAGEFEVTLRVRVRPGEKWALGFDPAVVDQLVPQLADVEAGRELFTRGKVFCFRSESAEVEQAGPPGPGFVFKGYDETGRPEWVEFHQVLLDLQDERVGDLFEAVPGKVALVQRGKDVKGRQLASFGRGSKTFSILGQVVAGYFPVPGNGGRQGVIRVAVTLQVVESRDRHGMFALHVNPVVSLPGGMTFSEAMAREWAPELGWAIGVAEQEVASLQQTVRAFRETGQVAAANRELGRVPSILRKLAEGIERGGRQERRRTKHVAERRKDQRPIHKALDDARHAPRAGWRYDEKAETLVVVGGRGRTHVFNAAGRHVTSLVLRDDAVQLRERTGRWRPLVDEEWKQIQGWKLLEDGSKEG